MSEFLRRRPRAAAAALLLAGPALLPFAPHAALVAAIAAGCLAPLLVRDSIRGRLVLLLVLQAFVAFATFSPSASLSLGVTYLMWVAVAAALVQLPGDPRVLQGLVYGGGGLALFVPGAGGRWWAAVGWLGDAVNVCAGAVAAAALVRLLARGRAPLACGTFAVGGLLYFVGQEHALPVWASAPRTVALVSVLWRVALGVAALAFVGELAGALRAPRRRGEAGARLAAWFQVASWPACLALGALAAIVAMAGQWTVSGAPGAWTRELLFGHLEWEVRLVQRVLGDTLVSVALLLVALCPHLVRNASDVFARAAPFGAAIALATAQAAHLVLMATYGGVRTIEPAWWLAATLPPLAAVGFAGLLAAIPSDGLRTTGRVAVLLAVTVFPHGIQLARAETPMEVPGIAWSLALAIALHRCVTNDRTVRRQGLALLGVWTVPCVVVWLIVSDLAESSYEGSVALVGMALFVVTFGVLFCCVLAARRARSLCAVPPDHAIVRDFGSGHPAAATSEVGAR